jgi:hypothetical protein
MRLILGLAVLLSGPALAQTAFLERRDYSARGGVVRVKLAVSHNRPAAVELTVRLKGAGGWRQHCSQSVSDSTG